jgi:UDP-N-acetylmuramate--alanine ligase
MKPPRSEHPTARVSRRAFHQGGVAPETSIPARARPAGRPALPALFGRSVRRIHGVGIGGMGLGPLAVYLAQLGFPVTGEDDALTPEMRAVLEREHVAIGPLPATCDLMVYSSAIAASHPARVAAAARGIPVARRGELLAEIARGKRLVAVCGSHGKTTTAAMLITALEHANLPVDYVLGGLFADGRSPARAAAGDWIVAEVDESDGTIELFAPEITVATNLDWDHPDYYRQPGEFERAFEALFGRTRRAVLLSDTCPLSARAATVATQGGRKTEAAPVEAPLGVTFGRSGDFRGEIVNESGEHMTLRLGGKFESEQAMVRGRGEFNAANATAALAAAQLMGGKMTRTMLACFPGVRRRQGVLHAGGGVTVLEDYAHHPAEIRALLGSLRSRTGKGGRVIVVFQPHRFSRTAQFKREFAGSLALANRVYLLDVYAAGEAPVAGGTTADILAELQQNNAAPPVNYFPEDDAGLHRALAQEVRPGDLVAFVGAGDIDRIACEWVRRRREAEAAPSHWDEIAASLRASVSSASQVLRDESLAARTTLRAGGAARIYAEPASVADLQALLRVAKARGIEVFALGRGSNLIVPDEGVDGLVIALTGEAWSVFELRGNGRVWAGAGLRLKNLCGLATRAGLVGFEFLEGIPGSIGGALRMNAGAMGGWMFDLVEEVQLIARDGEVKTLAKSAMHVDYRHCAELEDAIALGALLRPAAQADAGAIGRQIDVYRRKRHESQPREPSAGCIFKNPPGNSAGRLIDECGLKGERVGDAEVSPVHANFIVNRGTATGSDVLQLVRRVRARVREVKGVELQPEVMLYGRKWEDVL